MMQLADLAVALYWACTDFMIHTANLTGVTYRDTNAFMFFVLWPLVTVALFAVVLWQAAVLRRLRTQKTARPRVKAS